MSAFGALAYSRIRKLIRDLLAGFVLAGLFSMAGKAASTNSVWLDFQVTLRGQGGVENSVEEGFTSSQSWTYERSIAGFMEMSAESDSYVDSSNGKSYPMIVYRPKASGRTWVSGRLDDIATASARSYGAGGSYEDLEIDEQWNSLVTLPAKISGEASDIQFDLVPDKLRWFLTFAPRTWLGLLASEVPDYEGSGSLRHTSPGTGRSSFKAPPEWEHHAWSQEDRGPISTGYHPGGFSKLIYVPEIVEAWSVVLRFVGQSPEEQIFSGFFSTNLPPPKGVTTPWTMELDLHWSIEDRLPEVELVLEAEKNSTYLGWEPENERIEVIEGGIQLSYGFNTDLSLRADLRSPSGGDLSRIQVEKFVWRLVETSREPGTSMNQPLEARDSDYDLKLTGPGAIHLDPDGQAVEFKNPPKFSSRVEVSTTDSGAWGILQVEAHLADGRVIRGRLDPALADGPPYEEIRLPRRSSQSKIATSWKKRNRVNQLPDDADSDANPSGKPGAHGDGLTLYEEYRGFNVLGKHVRTDPRRKDLFVLNQAQGESQAIAGRAVQQFEAVSGLKVHRLAPGELATTRGNAINLNRKAGATRGPQAGLWLRTTGSGTRPNGAIPPGSRPGRIPFIQVPALPASIGRTAPLFRPGGGRGPAEGLQHMIVQALFQCVGVDRPGPQDEVEVFRLDAEGQSHGGKPTFVADGRPVLVLDFFGEDLAKKQAALLNKRLESVARPLEGESPEQTRQRVEQLQLSARTFPWLVGKRGGAHSGPEECLMRDWFADVYESRLPAADGRPVYRRIDQSRGPETPGHRLGSTRRGTGINDPARQPEPRYGDSAVAEPANRQMVVSDHE